MRLFRVPRLPPDQVFAIWQNTLEDQRDGILTGWFSMEELDNQFWVWELSCNCKVCSLGRNKSIV